MPHGMQCGIEDMTGCVTNMIPFGIMGVALYGRRVFDADCLSEVSLMHPDVHHWVCGISWLYWQWVMPPCPKANPQYCIA
jgi:hypothetical protein